MASQTSYSLTSLAASVLKFNRVEVRASHRAFCDRVMTLMCCLRRHAYAQVDPMDVPRFFSSAEDILKIAEHCAVDAMLVQVRV